MKSVFKRFGTQAIKFTVTVNVQDVVLPMIRGVDRGDFLIVSLERGSHVVDTKEVKITDISSTGDMTVEFDEDLTLEATLYRDSQGSYQEKSGNLVVRHRKKNTPKDSGKAGYKDMGLVPLELHKLTRKKESSQTASLVWSAREGALIHYTITMTNESDDDDEGNDEEDEESSPPKNKAMARGADKRTKLSEAENEEEDDWKPSFNDKWDKGETATGGKKTTSTDADPWGAVDPFAEEGDPFVASQNRKSAAAGGAGKKTGGKNQAQNTADVEVEEEPTGPLSPEAQEWKKEWVELQEENKVLRERESGLNAITGKADYYEQEAQRLEQLLKDMQSEHKQILNQKLEIEAELKGRIAENEVLVQEVIATKLSLVDLATELDVTRKTTQQLRQRLGLVGSRAAAGEVAIARQMMGQQQPQQRMPSQQQQQQQQRPVSQQYQQQQQQQQPIPTQRRPPSSQNQAALQQQQTYSSPRGQPQQSRGMADPYAYQEEPVKVQPVRRAPKRA